MATTSTITNATTTKNPLRVNSNLEINSLTHPSLEADDTHNILVVWISHYHGRGTCYWLLNKLLCYYQLYVVPDPIFTLNFYLIYV